MPVWERLRGADGRFRAATWQEWAFRAFIDAICNFEPDDSFTTRAAHTILAAVVAGPAAYVANTGRILVFQYLSRWF